MFFTLDKKEPRAPPGSIAAWPFSNRDKVSRSRPGFPAFFPQNRGAFLEPYIFRRSADALPFVASRLATFVDSVRRITLPANFRHGALLSLGVRDHFSVSSVFSLARFLAWKKGTPSPLSARSRRGRDPSTLRRTGSSVLLYLRVAS